MTKGGKLVLRLLGLALLVVFAPFIAFAILVIGGGAQQALACGNEPIVVLTPSDVEIDEERLLSQLAVMTPEGPLDAKQLFNARVIIGIGLSRGRGERDILIALTAAIHESALRNMSVSGVFGLGLFAMRAGVADTEGNPLWGTPDELTDVVYAPNRFYTSLENVKQRDEFSIEEAAQAALDTKESYGEWVPEAAKILDSVTSSLESTGDISDWQATACVTGVEAVIGSGSGSGSGGGSVRGLVVEMKALGYKNGLLPSAILVDISDTHRCLVTIFAGAVEQTRLLEDAAHADGVDLEIGGCYRPLASQQDAWDRRHCEIPGNCDGDPHPPTARPGTSNHGWALAIDFWNQWNGSLRCNDAEFVWMQKNAHRFGYVHPNWARCFDGGSLRRGREPWHWEFVGIASDDIPSEQRE